MRYVYLPEWHLCNNEEQEKIENICQNTSNIEACVKLNKHPLYAYYLIEHLDVLNLITDEDGRKTLLTLLEPPLIVLIRYPFERYVKIDFSVDFACYQYIDEPYQLGYIFWQVSNVIAKIYQNQFDD